MTRALEISSPERFQKKIKKGGPSQHISKGDWDLYVAPEWGKCLLDGGGLFPITSVDP